MVAAGVRSDEDRAASSREEPPASIDHELSEDVERADGPPKLSSLALPAWATGVGGFLLYNYYFATAPWPPGLLEALPVRAWALIHAISGAAFAGGILTTAFLEWLVVTSGVDSVQRFWYRAATRTERALVLPGLTGSLLSGVAQVRLGSVSHAALCHKRRSSAPGQKVRPSDVQPSM